MKILLVAGAFYHVTSRGNERKDIFKSRRVKDKIRKDKKLEGKISKIEKKDRSVKNEDLSR